MTAQQSVRRILSGYSDQQFTAGTVRVLANSKGPEQRLHALGFWASLVFEQEMELVDFVAPDDIAFVHVLEPRPKVWTTMNARREALTVRPHDYVLVPAGHMNSWDCRSSSGPVLHMLISAKALAETCDVGLYQVDPRLGHRDPVLDHAVRLCMHALIDEEGRPALYWDGVAMLIASSLVSLSLSRKPLLNWRGGLSSSQLRRSTELLHESASGDIAVADLAEAAGLSPFHFSRMFKRSTGQTPYRYQLRVRLDRAKLLLRDTDLTVHDVAVRVGFANAASLSRAFRREVGVAPAAFRRTTRI